MTKQVLVPFRDHTRIAPYADAIRTAGMEPVIAEATAPLHFDTFAGLVLTGGTDVNPRLFGEEPHPETEEPDDERDAIEISLIQEALARQAPILAICRGLQLLNVARGGSLVQHLDSVQRHKVRTFDRGLTAHDVEVEPDSLLARVTGARKLSVNSRHHQAAGRIGAGLRVSARAEDGVVEGLEMPGERFVLAVQWHPEDQVFKDAKQLRLFEGFAEAL